MQHFATEDHRYQLMLIPRKRKDDTDLLWVPRKDVLHGLPFVLTSIHYCSQKLHLNFSHCRVYSARRHDSGNILKYKLYSKLYKEKYEGPISVCRTKKAFVRFLSIICWWEQGERQPLFGIQKQEVIPYMYYQSYKSQNY